MKNFLKIFKIELSGIELESVIKELDENKTNKISKSSAKSYLVENTPCSLSKSMNLFKEEKKQKELWKQEEEERKRKEEEEKKRIEEEEERQRKKEEEKKRKEEEEERQRKMEEEKKRKEEEEKNKVKFFEINPQKSFSPLQDTFAISTMREKKKILPKCETDFTQVLPTNISLLIFQFYIQSFIPKYIKPLDIKDCGDKKIQNLFFFFCNFLIMNI